MRGLRGRTRGPGERGSWAAGLAAVLFLLLCLLAQPAPSAGSRRGSTVQEEVNRLITRDGLRTMQIALELYRRETGAYPRDLEEILRHKNITERSVIQDAWGNPYHYTRLDGTYQLFSVGADGKAFTGDDIHPEPLERALEQLETR
ncbi:MAG: type II secretion system protein GspG [Spirochaetota bacterium]